MIAYRKIGSDVQAIQWNPQIALDCVQIDGANAFFTDARGIRIAISEGDWIVHFSATDQRVLPDAYFRQHYVPVTPVDQPAQ